MFDPAPVQQADPSDAVHVSAISLKCDRMSCKTSSQWLCVVYFSGDGGGIQLTSGGIKPLDKESRAARLWTRNNAGSQGVFSVQAQVLAGAESATATCPSFEYILILCAEQPFRPQGASQQVKAVKIRHDRKDEMPISPRAMAGLVPSELMAETVSVVHDGVEGLLTNFSK